MFERVKDEPPAAVGSSAAAAEPILDGARAGLAATTEGDELRR
ncbi:MAG: hypothetical protein AAFV62_01485 [Pseudomonadota bacterium]